MSRPTAHRGIRVSVVRVTEADESEELHVFGSYEEAVQFARGRVAEGFLEQLRLLGGERGDRRAGNGGGREFAARNLGTQYVEVYECTGVMEWDSTVPFGCGGHFTEV